MNYQKVKAEAAREILYANRAGTQIELVEYLNKQSYLADHPNGLPFAHHNSLVCEFMREVIQSRVPFRVVGKLTLPRQTAFDPAKDGSFEDLSFEPAHPLAAHKPLGGINCPSLSIYQALSHTRLS